MQAVVRGRVQGVGFRLFVIQRARALGVAGYVRNLPDGFSVMVEAEGERDQLEHLLADLRRGPAGAQVKEVEIAWLEYHGTSRDFRIQR